MEDYRDVEFVVDTTFAESFLERPSRRAANIFLHRLDPRNEPVRALVYGSRARGDAGRDSDLDLAVILAGPPGDRWKVAREMARLAFDVLLETDVLIDPLPLWEVELERPDSFCNPALLRAILRDGVEP